MAKSPRKSATSIPLSSKSYPKIKSSHHSIGKKSNFGGKATKYYHGHKTNRRFSIVDSSSSDSEKTINNRGVQSSDSESSLTAVSEDESNSILKNKKKLYNSRKSLKSSKVNFGRKHVPKKSMKRNHNWNQVEKSDDDDEDDEDDDEDEEEEEEDEEEEEEEDGDEVENDLDSPGDLGLEGLYSLMNTSQQSDVSGASDDDDEDEDLASSSDDDVDFVQLQAERKAARVALKTNQKDALNQTKPRTNSISKSKFGRRKSNVVLPEDINFTFDFGDLNNEDVIVDDFEEVSKSLGDNMDIDNEEDVGEEITPTNDSIDITKDQFNSDFDFDTPMIPVPKIKDEDLNSDDEYEFDDNELLATLYADNDMDEFIDDDYVKKSRKSSMGSIGEDDPFLKEEEKFLVNEFENNGFDDELEDFQTNDKQLIDSFNESDQNKKNVVQYESSVASESERYDDDDEDEFDDFVDFDVPIFDDNIDESNLSDGNSDKPVGQYFKKPNKQSNKIKPKKKSKKRLQNAVINSDEDDDSYLWNYFFSSGESEDEDNVERYNDASEDEELDVDQLFPDMNTKSRRLSQANTRKSMSIANNDSFELDNGYESGDSTDEDLNLPKPSNKSKVASKKAKEVLSSKTADYRPPILGTWVAVDSRPFGIIDGLSTRTLMTSNNINKGAEPRKGRKSIIPAHNDELALGLDELLNISELDDDDENDIRIWRDFNNQKKQIPLGAFRNKSSQNPLISYTHNGQSKEFTNTGYGSPYSRKNSISRGVVKKSNTTRRNSINNSKQAPDVTNGRNAKSKLGRRRSSIAEAVSEGYRPTKSGLFSESALADIEEVLGDDNEFLALIKGI